MIAVYLLRLTYNALTFKHIACRLSLSIGQNEAIIATSPTYLLRHFSLDPPVVTAAVVPEGFLRLMAHYAAVRTVLDPNFLNARP